MPVGTSTVLNVDRDGKKMEFRIVVEDRLKVFADDPRVAGENVTPTADVNKPAEVSLVQFGIGVRPLTEEEKALTTDKRGLYVTRVEPGSFASEIGMQERDIVTSVNRHPVSSREDVQKVQATLKPGDPVAFHVVRTQQFRGNAATQSMWLSGTLPQ
jgi:serine protease Do